MTTPIHCGMLGTGHAHAPGKLEALRNSCDYLVTGVCEPDEAQRRERQGEGAFQGVTWVDADALLGDKAVEMVAIESDVPHLLEYGRMAIDAGKHIHLDKPAGMSLPDFKALLDEAARKNLIVQMGYMFRYSAAFDLVREALKEGWLGEVHLIETSMSKEKGAEGREEMNIHPGGAMFDLASHLIDMIVLLMGRPERVTPFVRHDGRFDDTLADNTLAVLEFERAMAVVHSNVMEIHAFPHRRFKITGKKGSVIIEPLEPPVVQLCLSKATGEFEKGWQEVPLEPTARYVRDLEELADCIREEKPLPYSKEHDYAVQETLLKACGVEV